MAASPLPAPVAGYSFDQSPNLSDGHVRQNLSGAAIRGFLNITSKWDLPEAQSRKLLGDIASSTFHAWRKAPDKQRLSQDTLLRISLVIGIYKALNIYFDQPLADQWIMLQNRGSLFGGRTPVEYMIHEGQPGMMRVRQMLDAWRGGQ